MRTAIIIVGGVVLFLVAAYAAHRAGGDGAVVTIAKVFLVIWPILALLNLWAGVARAGYTVAEELPIFLVIAAVPMAIAGFAWWKYA